MNASVQLKRYNKKIDYSYSMGTFPTIEMLKYKPAKVLKILVHSQLHKDKQFELISTLCRQNQIILEQNDKAIERIRDKESCLVIGVFEKFVNVLDKSMNHVVLVNPSDMGNMGTIIRTCIGFGIKDLAIISPGVDIYNPKVVRASMGSLFHLNFVYYESYEEYKSNYGERMVYLFMLEGVTELSKVSIDKTSAYSLVFGNESSGLDDSYSKEGTSVFIKHSSDIDSLNLSMAVGIGLYEFTNMKL